MELEGLKRALAFLEQNGVEVAVLVTDRHVQIKCFLRREKSNIKHEFDAWHVAKGYVQRLLSVIMLEASEPGPKKQKVATPKYPPLSSSFAKVQKEVVVASHTTRFNN
ncbi:hypothetical protein HPB48_025960 [Haemaphysalis longicornis]|uniref:Uncharacterized protein n=1 Tax=Haemaphysalis longicornis TaxID=44386 RepID=A0A9J6GZV6_HAELO|nr:hypothetical protein HPB48_025960 [Haemaphysalis longicornis]